MSALTLVEFLTARLDDDEADWRVVDAREVVQLLHGRPLAPRMLADVEAKRRIMARHSRTGASHWSRAGNCEGCGFYGDNDLPVIDRDTECPELVDLASVYADHPDFRDEWKP